MDAPVKVACIQAEPVILDREATIDKLAALAAEAAGQRRAAARLPGGVRPRLPVLGLGEGARRLGRARREGGVRAARARVGRGARRRPRRRIGETAARARRLDRHRRHRESTPRARGRSTTRCSTTRPTATLALKHRKLVPTNHERLVWGQGDGDGPARDRDAARPDRRADLLGELHAARALRALRVRASRSTSPRPRTTATRGSRRSSTSPASRARSSSRPRHFQRAASYPDDFPLARAARGRRT